MILELLICTIDKGVEKVPKLLLPPIHNVKYLVSWQCADLSSSNSIPEALRRDDVKVVTMQGKGLSRNRNNAIANATGDVCLIADDDCAYQPAHLNKVIEIFEAHPAVDIATFKMQSSYAAKAYPSFSFDLRQEQTNYYVSSVEMAFRRTSIQGKLKFNELFGLGAPVLAACEENVFILNALAMNLHCEYFPYVIVEHNHPTTSTSRSTEPGVLMANGAYLPLAYPGSEYTRAFMMAKRINAKHHCGYFRALHYILRGISYIKKNTKK